jgi:hypothetical protein
LFLVAVSLSRRSFENQFSHWQASFFLLLRQKKETKEKATRMPLAPCAPSFLLGFARRDFLSLWQSAASLPRPFGLFPTKTPVLGAAYGTNRHLRNMSYSGSQ